MIKSASKHDVSTRPIKLVVHWARFGPYHLARLNGLQQYAAHRPITVVGLETAGTDAVYGWRQERAAQAFERFTLFPEREFYSLGMREIWSACTQQLATIQPDVVAVSGYNLADARAILWWCRRNKRPAILMTESHVDDAPRSALKESIKRLVVRQFAAGFCGGQRHKRYLQMLGMSPDRIFTGYDAVDNAYFRERAAEIRANPGKIAHLPGLSKTDPYFLASARFICRKNIDGLLRAYSLFQHRFQEQHGQPSNWRLIILGDGELNADLKALTATLDLNNHVVWPGFRQIDEIPAYYAFAGVFIHPPHREQWGLVVNEAMASGLPVLVSRECGCAPDLVSDGQNGFTFDSGNSVQLAELMLDCVDGSYDLGGMSRASERIVEGYSPTAFARGLGNAVSTILATSWLPPSSRHRN